MARQWMIALLLGTLLLLLIRNVLLPKNIYKNLKDFTQVEQSLQHYKNKKYGTSSPTIINSALVETNNKNDNNKINDRCHVIHVGFVSSGFRSHLYLHTLLKSIYFYNREHSFHFHLVTNNHSENVLKTLFSTWGLPQTNVTFYNINDSILDIRWVPNSHYSGIFGLLKLVFPKIIPLNVTSQIIVLDTDLTFMADIAELWRIFLQFTEKQAVGVVENQSDYYLWKTSKTRPWPAIGKGFNSGVILYHLQKLHRMDWPKLWPNVTKKIASAYGSTRLGDQDIMNAVLVEYPELLHQVPCYWNTQLSDHTQSYNCYNEFRIKVVHWNSPKKVQVVNKDSAYFKSVYTTFLELNGNLLRQKLYSCSLNGDLVKKGSFEIEVQDIDVCSEFHRATTSQWRTLLFFRDYKYVSDELDVTFVAQSSFNRIQMVEELIKFWEGPISITLYLTDPEFQQAIDFIERSELLQERDNIAYHAVFKEGEYYPINILRNVGLSNVNTAYVFLADIDFLPMRGSYAVIKKHLSSMGDMRKKALIIPAFETQRYRSKLPKSKIQLLSMLEKKSMFPFRYDVWSAGHAPTDYSRWKSATSAYKVKWEADFEPYVVVHSGVTPYEQSFMGFGWNKVSHIMELEAQGYEWIVIPNAFIIHKPHAPSYDIAKFRSSPVYRMCLQNLKNDFIQKLNKKYGRVFDTRNTSLLVST